MGEGGFQRFSMLGMGGGFQVVHDAYARELQIFALLIATKLLGGFGRRRSSSQLLFV